MVNTTNRFIEVFTNLVLETQVFLKDNVLQQLFYDLKDRFNKYGRRKKMIQLQDILNEQEQFK